MLDVVVQDPLFSIYFVSVAVVSLTFLKTSSITLTSTRDGEFLGDNHLLQNHSPPGRYGVKIGFPVVPVCQKKINPSLKFRWGSPIGDYFMFLTQLITYATKILFRLKTLHQHISQ